MSAATISPARAGEGGLLRAFASQEGLLAIAIVAVAILVGLFTFAVNLLVSLVIAAPADYIIFLIGRYQQARSHGQDQVNAFYVESFREAQ